MKTLYLDIFSGISGDMFVGALLDLGVSLDALRNELARLGIAGYRLECTRDERHQISGCKFHVHLDEQEAEEDAGSGSDTEHSHGHSHTHQHTHEHSHTHGHSHTPGEAHTHSHEHQHTHGEGHGGTVRTFAMIRRMIAESSLPEWVRERSVAVFRRIAEAEGKVHHVPVEEVHFHEVGALDSIVDIVGGCVALDLLGRPRLLAASVVEGHGWLDCAHGRFPIPSAATLEILGARGIPVTQTDEPHELVTPTGAALLAEFVEEFGPMAGLKAERVGYGLGTRKLATRPNVLRAVLGETTSNQSPGSPAWESDRVCLLETNLDDCHPEWLGHFVEVVLEAGALDVFSVPVQMKKNRPGVVLSVLCAEVDADALTRLLLIETTAFGVRRTFSERRKLKREYRSVTTEFGEVSVKLGLLAEQVVQTAPEYASCARLAAEVGVPLRRVYEAALRAVGGS